MAGKIIIARFTPNSKFMPQGTVDNNLWPECLAGPKALDINECRQPTLFLTI